MFSSSSGLNEILVYSVYIPSYTKSDFSLNYAIKSAFRKRA